MKYKEEFLDTFGLEENVKKAKLLMSLLEPFEKKFNKDFTEFTAEEIQDFHHSLLNLENGREMGALLMNCIKFAHRMNQVNCEWEIIDRKEIE